MDIRKVTDRDITLAAWRASVGLLNLRPVNASRTAWRVRLVPLTMLDGNGARWWQRYSASWRHNRDGSRRKVNGVCWHGHRAFMRALYVLAPGAVIRTAHATYRGAEHFEATHGATADKQVGAPVAFGDLCDCRAT